MFELLKSCPEFIGIRFVNYCVWYAYGIFHSMFHVLSVCYMWNQECDLIVSFHLILTYRFPIKDRHRAKLSGHALSMARSSLRTPVMLQPLARLEVHWVDTHSHTERLQPVDCSQFRHGSGNRVCVTTTQTEVAKKDINMSRRLLS